MRHRGVTLIEAVLFISIALGLIVGGIVFFQQASLASRVSAQVRILSAIVQETRALYSQTAAVDALPAFGPGSLFGQQTDAILIAAGAVPATIVDTSGATPGLRTEWDGTLSVFAGRESPTRTAVVLYLADVPVAACTRLAPVSAQGEGVFANAVIEIYFGEAATATDLDASAAVLSAPITPGDAASVNGCSSGGAATTDMWVVAELF